MRIVFIITGLEVGGAEKQLLTLLPHYSMENSVKVISISPKNRLITEFQELCEVKVYDFSKPWNIIKLIHFLNKDSIDVIHSHMVHSNLFTLFYALLNRRVKIFLTSHNINEGNFLFKYVPYLTKLSERIKYSHVDPITIVSLERKDINVRLYKNPIEVKKYHSNNINRDGWCVVASHTEQKNLFFLIDIFKDLNLNLHVYGDGKLTQSLIEYAGNNSSIIFYGYRDDVSDCLKDHFGFILTSLWEGLPVSFIEALSSNLRVIVPRVGGLEQMFIKYDIEGEIIDGYDVHFWREKVLRQNALPLASNNAIIANNWDVSSVYKDLIKWYKE